MKASKCEKVIKVIKVIKAILAFMRLQSGVPILFGMDLIGSQECVCLHSVGSVLAEFLILRGQIFDYFVADMILYFVE